MKEYSTSINPMALESIKNGSKTIEGRLRSPKFAKMKAGDFITFYYNCDKIRTEISKIEYYLDFDTMLEKIDTSKLNSYFTEKKQLLNVYRKPSGFYHIADERRYGVMAIFLKI